MEFGQPAQWDDSTFVGFLWDFSPQQSRIGRNHGVPTGIRTPVAAVRGRCPRPLDDGDAEVRAKLTRIPRDGPMPEIEEGQVAIKSFRRPPKYAGGKASGVLAWNPGNAGDTDAFLGQVLDVLRRRLAINPPLLAFAIMDGACFLGKP